MSTLETLEIDPYDDAAVDAWHAALLRGESHGREATAAAFQLEEARPLLQERGRAFARHAYVGLIGDVVVAAALVERSLLDNLGLAQVSLCVVPEARRLGHGTALLQHVERQMLAVDRSVLGTETWWPVDGDPVGRGTPGVEFALAHGFTLGLVELQRRLELPVPGSLLERLAAEAAPYHSSYSLVSFSGPLPDDLVEGWCRLDASLMTEAPLGDLEREPMAVDVAAQREAEARIVAQGRTKYTTLALDQAGEVVAYSDCAMTIHEPGRAYQWGTLVRPADRGHRLGLAVKVANLRQLQAAHPELTVMRTWNAGSNDHMNAVNEALGFVPVEHLGSFQKQLTRH